MFEILKFLNFLGKIPILKEFERFEWFEWFEWFGPSPIEPFNSGGDRAVADQRRLDRDAAREGPGDRLRVCIHFARSFGCKHLGDLYAESGQTRLVTRLVYKARSPAVSKPNFASKYSLESSRRDLHNALLCTAFGIHMRKLGKKGPKQPRKGRKQETERPLSSSQHAT